MMKLVLWCGQPIQKLWLFVSRNGFGFRKKDMGKLGAPANREETLKPLRASFSRLVGKLGG